MRARFLFGLTLAAAVAAGAAATADAKVARVAFDEPRASSGSTVGATLLRALPPPVPPVEDFRVFLVHMRHVHALFPKRRSIHADEDARELLDDRRLTEVTIEAPSATEPVDVRAQIELTLPSGLRPGRYTSLVYVCTERCTLHAGLNARTRSELARLNQWDRPLVLRVVRPE